MCPKESKYDVYSPPPENLDINQITNLFKIFLKAEL